MTLIGIGGAAGSGKDAFAGTLRDEFGFRVMGMSDALSDALYTLDPIVFLPYAVRLPDGSALGSHKHLRYRALVDLVGYTEAKTVPEVRRLLQFLGTEVGRNMISENVWVDMVVRRILTQNDTPVAVTGIRYANELDMIRSLGGVTVYIARPAEENTLRAHVRDSQPKSSQHSSETSVSASDFDTCVENGSTLKDLAEQARAFARRLSSARPVAHTQGRG